MNFSKLGTVCFKRKLTVPNNNLLSPIIDWKLYYLRNWMSDFFSFFLIIWRKIIYFTFFKKMIRMVFITNYMRSLNAWDLCTIDREKQTLKLNISASKCQIKFKFSGKFENIVNYCQNLKWFLRKVISCLNYLKEKMTL